MNIIHFGVFVIKNIFFSLIIFVLITSHKSYGIELTYPSDITPFQKRQIEFFWEHIAELKSILDSFMRTEKSSSYIDQVVKNNNKNKKILENLAPLAQILKTTVDKIRSGQIGLDKLNGTPYQLLQSNHIDLDTMIDSSRENMDVAKDIIDDEKDINKLLYYNNLTNILKIYSQLKIRTTLQNQLKNRGYLEFQKVLDSYQPEYRSDLDITNYSEDMQEIAKKAETKGDLVIFCNIFPMLSDEVKKELLGETTFDFLRDYRLNDFMDALYFIKVLNPIDMIRIPENIE
jgi:hypothetical protein